MVSVRSTIRKENSPVDADTPLLWVLGDLLGMTGTNSAAVSRNAATCTVQLVGVAVRSCRLSVGQVATGPAGPSKGAGGAAVGARVQQAWLDLDVIQCGSCQSGQIMAMKFRDAVGDAAPRGEA